MSRIGKHPIPVPAGVEVKIEEGNKVTVKGPKGELSQSFSSRVNIEQEDGHITVSRDSDDREARSLHGLTRTLINNMVVGVHTGFAKKLEIVGVGYRAALKGKNLEMQLGYSHPVVVEPKEGISFEVPNQTTIIVHGIDKQQVGQVAADIRAWRAPEPYKGKGIRYSGENVRRKLGKAAG
ncbi:MAG: 50S ribosomal protein L6 [Coriobacteriales bacterium]|nr:50S ribosomal protein L6 [Coriobacteriales bacterium]MBQ6586028.1 50S ribosomal protein L6 [Coriobacteriales bacterium]